MINQTQNTTESVHKIVKESFEKFGETKRYQIERLVFEIAKREDMTFNQVIADVSEENTAFEDVKGALIKRRYPELNGRYPLKDFYLGKLDVDPANKVHLVERVISPNNIYIEESVQNSILAKRMLTMFPQAKVESIDTYREFTKSKPFGLKDYNNRLDHFFVVREEYDFFKKCPCSPKTVSCGYHVVNLGSGCAFDCSYCYLPAYINSPGILFPANVEDFFDEFKKYKQDIRIGSGEYTDSLVFDHISEYSPQIVNFFKDYPKSLFEFKTKSDNVGLLLNENPAGNIVVGWSINPPHICNEIEHYTASFEERLEAARACQQAGYKIAFHFDPIFHYENWEEDYRYVVDRIYGVIKPENIAWISLGTLRMTDKLRKAVENRFPESNILNNEMVIGFDRKIRYDVRVRNDIYTKMTAWIRSYDSAAKVYLCMEEKSICNDCQSFPFTKK
jgi:spore photoproduct lyase